MNTAVRTFTSRTISLWMFPVSITKQQLMIACLGLAVLLSAFGVIYQQDVNRRLVSQYENLQMTHNQLHNQWTQLVEQKSALANQTRVAQMAKKDFNMAMPAPKSVVMLSV